MRSLTMASYDICKHEECFYQAPVKNLLTAGSHLFNKEHVLLTSPKALAEVLTGMTPDHLLSTPTQPQHLLRHRGLSPVRLMTMTPV